MKTSYLNVVLTLTCMLGFGISAQGQDASEVVVNVPFEFVAGGKTLPAGTYSVGRSSPDLRFTLFIYNKNNGGFTLLLPSVPDGKSAGHAALSFERIGGKRFLSKAETPAGIFTILTPRAVTKLAQMDDRNATPSSGTN